MERPRREHINVKPDEPAIIANRIAVRLRLDGVRVTDSMIEAIAEEIHFHLVDRTIGV